MKLTSYSNYAMRVLMVAACRSPRLTTISEVAEAFGISRANLMKCVQQLSAWGFLETLRGTGGGFRLAMDAGAIAVGDVLRRTERDFDLVECFDDCNNTCPLVARCTLKPALRRATQAFLKAFDSVTLADITDHADALLARLRLDGPQMSHGNALSEA